MANAQSRIGQQAAAWVVKFDGVDFNAGDVRAFRRWLAKSDAHRAAFETASKTWNRLDLLSRLEAFPLPQSDTPAIGRRGLLAGAGAAALAVGVVGYIALSPGPAEAFETAAGEVREVRLQDGTSVVLNADTRIETRTASDRRTARLVRGEALFTIAARDGHPFSISTADGRVDAESGQVLIKVLSEGARVSFLSAPGRARRSAALSADQAITAGPGSEIELGPEEMRVAQADASLLSRRTLWREGRLAFDDTPLSEAVKDVTRQTGVRFVFDDPALENLRVSGLIDARDLDAFLLLLRENLAINAERGTDGVIRLSSTASFAP